MRKWKWLIIVLILGGVMVFFSLNGENSKHRYELESLRKEQDRMVHFIVHEYENIEKIEFTTFRKNTSSGTWTANAIINDNILVSFSVHDLGNNSEIGFGQHIYHSRGNRLLPRTNNEIHNNLNNIEIIYGEWQGDK